MEQQEKKPNRIFCTNCSTIITSTHIYDFKWCNCKDEKKRVAVDGGDDYARRVGNFDNFIELSYKQPTLEQIENSNSYNVIRNISLDIINCIKYICQRSLMIKEKINLYSYRNHNTNIKDELITFDLSIFGINREGDKEFFIQLVGCNFTINVQDINKDGERILNKRSCINKMFEYNKKDLETILQELEHNIICIL